MKKLAPKLQEQINIPTVVRDTTTYPDELAFAAERTTERVNTADAGFKVKIYTQGLTKREYFASILMASLIASPKYTANTAQLAEDAIKAAINLEEALNNETKS